MKKLLLITILLIASLNAFANSSIRISDPNKNSVSMAYLEQRVAAAKASINDVLETFNCKDIYFSAPIKDVPLSLKGQATCSERYQVLAVFHRATIWKSTDGTLDIKVFQLVDGLKHMIFEDQYIID